MLRTTLLSAFCLTLSGLCSQNFDSACVQQRHVSRMLEVLHFSPPEFDRQTGQEIMDLFIRQADEKNIFFSQKDADALHHLASRVSPPDLYCAAIHLSYVIYTYKLRLLDSLTQLVAEGPMLLDGSDTINFVYRKRDRLFYENTPELHQRIGKRLKYDVLRTIGRSRGSRQGDLSAQLIETTRIRSLKKFRRSFEKLHDPDVLVAHLADCMSDAIARRCDPHSNYLNASGFGNYRNALSAHERSFGFAVSENNAGDLEIGELVPGGPAWNSEHLSEKDQIVAIRSGDSELIPANELGVEEINSLLEEASVDVIELVITGTDGQERTVRLTREVIHSAQNLIAGFVVDLNGTKIGHISIPAFYLDNEPDGHNGCANDVAREIFRLQQDSIEGLIIDLRFNGGGSMREAIALAGLFIDEGPVAVYHPKNETPFILKDIHRGSVWHGPLLVLINGASASASEFLAAALQDHGRAIIAGTKSFGKGTAQNLLPADTSAMVSVYSPNPNAAMKITGGKFYRLTGQSLQARGIEPDVTIPGILEHVIRRESELPYALPCDSVKKSVGYHVVPVSSKEELVRRSNSRLLGPRFSEIVHLADSMRSVAGNTERVALDLEDYLAYRQQQKKLNDRIEKLFSARDPEITIKTTSAASALMEYDSFLRRRHQRTLSALSNDIVFHESVRIMSDMIELRSP